MQLINDLTLLLHIFETEHTEQCLHEVFYNSITLANSPIKSSQLRTYNSDIGSVHNNNFALLGHNGQPM